MWDETVAGMKVIWGKTERKYFSLWEWTGSNTPNLARRAEDSCWNDTINRHPLLCAFRIEVSHYDTSEMGRFRTCLQIIANHRGGL